MTTINTVTQPMADGGWTGGTPGIIPNGALATAAYNFQQLLGPNVSVTHSDTTGEYPTHHGFPHATQGLPLLLQGRADVISSDILAWQSTFSDPIRVIFGTRITDVPMTIIEERELISAPAIIAPERTMAKTVSIKYRSFNVRMKRLAIDAMFNTNAFLEMASAIKEVDFKLKGITQAMEVTILHLAYSAALQHGVKLDEALKQASAVNQHLSNEQRIRRADRKYAQTICGALHDPFGVKNLMLSVASSNVYTPSGDSRSQYQVALLPNLLGATEYTKPEKLNFYISGLSATDIQEPYECETTAYTSADWGNLKVLTYTAGPGLSRQSDRLMHELGRVISFGTFYIEKRAGIAPTTSNAEDHNDCMPCIVTDFVDHDWFRLPRASVRGTFNADGSVFTPAQWTPASVVAHNVVIDANAARVAATTAAVFGDAAERRAQEAADLVVANRDLAANPLVPSTASYTDQRVTQLNQTAAALYTDDGVELTGKFVWWARPKMDVYAESGLLCTNAGSETAEILITKPSSKIASSEVVDEARVMVRTLAGAIVKKPQNLLVLRDIRFCGIAGGAGVRWKTYGHYNHKDTDLLLFITTHAPSDPALWKEPSFIAQCEDYIVYSAATKIYRKTAMNRKDAFTEPIILYRGTTRLTSGNIRSMNNGHLRKNDHPNNGACVYWPARAASSALIPAAHPPPPQSASLRAISRTPILGRSSARRSERRRDHEAGERQDPAPQVEDDGPAGAAAR
jgi:hypothetical protein